MPKAAKLRELVVSNNQTTAQMEEITGQLQEKEIEIIKLKAALDPELLSKEEVQVFSEIQREELTLYIILGGKEYVDRTFIISGRLFR